ncbi:hypothetical protein [Sphingorhabdus sp.]|nr:hypothetical protein [Sphingorhabdus sp.]
MPDFDAVAEVVLEGRWHLVDSSRLPPEEHLVRLTVDVRVAGLSA